MIIIFYITLNNKMKKFSSIGIYPSLNILKIKLRAQNSILLSYKIFRLPSYLKFKERIKAEEIILFFQELAILLKSGLSLLNSLTLMKDNLKNPSLKLLVIELIESISSGKSLKSSIGCFKNSLSPFYMNLIIIGEESGTLPETLELISENSKRALFMKKKIHSLMIYPIFVFCLTTILSIILINFVLPEFVKIFSENNIQLPLITRVLFKTYYLFSNYLYSITAIFLSTAIAIYFFIHSEKGKTNIYISLTKFSPLYRGYSSYFLLKNLSLLLESGISLFSGIKLLHLVEENPLLKTELAYIIEILKKGNTLHSSIKNSYIFPKTALSMVKVGENTGTLPFMISNASELVYYRFNTTMERILTFIEPVTLLILGGLIGTIILGLYLPMFDAFSLIK